MTGHPPATATLHTGDPVTALALPNFTCPRCAEPMRYINGRPPGDTGLATMAIFRCDQPTCRRVDGEWELRVELIATAAPKGPPVGWAGLPRKKAA